MEAFDIDGRIFRVEAPAGLKVTSVVCPYFEEAETIVFIGPGLETLGSEALWEREDAASAAPLWDSELVVSTGDPANRIDIVFLGDGYTAGELDTFDTHVGEGIAYLLTRPPYDDYAGYINFWKVNVISNESGADDPCVEPPVYVDTALDSSYCWDGTTDRLLYADSAKVYAAAASAPDYDEILVTVNHTKYGGGGGAFAVYAAGNSSALDIAYHEYGHSFSGLADEYYYTGWTYSGPELSQVNVTKYDKTYLEANSHKWYYWIGIRDIDVFEGCQYYQFGKYRPHNNCEMRSLFRDLCAVCQEKTILEIYNVVRPLDSYSPTEDLEINENESQTFSVSTPSNPALEFTWSVNGNIQAETGPSLELTGAELGPGLHAVEVMVEDMTELVLVDPSSVLSESHSWNLTVLENCGNGELQSGEECDDGNNEDGDGCDANCNDEYCGDGIVNDSGQEECDDGNNTIGDGCDAACIAEVCGNGIVQFGEECDDGNNDSGDGCDANCMDEFCNDDLDDDGYIAVVCGGDDCDDTDPLSFPGAEEICDGMDNDCDENTDEEPEASASCDDGEACTTNETCSAGACVSDPLDCDDSNACTDDTCNPDTGCVYTNNTDPCDDMLFCNGIDTCLDGTCSHSGNPCDPVTQTCNEDLEICEDLGCGVGYLCVTCYLNGHWTGSGYRPDTIDIELHSGLDSPAATYSGIPLDEDCVASVELTGIEDGLYEVVVRQANHIDLVSTEMVSLSLTGSNAIDFSDPDNVACGESALIWEASNGGKWTMPGGDASGDGSVNIFDYFSMGQQWGGAGPESDYTGDGAVNIFDYFILGQNWGRSECPDVQ
ncbi:M64 family metallopeptidase [Thermodesulfobacteriota bacterium]